MYLIPRNKESKVVINCKKWFEYFLVYNANVDDFLELISIIFYILLIQIVTHYELNTNWDKYHLEILIKWYFGKTTQTAKSYEIIAWNSLNDYSNSLRGMKIVINNKELIWIFENKFSKELPPPGNEPATLCVWDTRDNRYTTETWNRCSNLLYYFE